MIRVLLQPLVPAPEPQRWPSSSMSTSRPYSLHVASAPNAIPIHSLSMEIPSVSPGTKPSPSLSVDPSARVTWSQHSPCWFASVWHCTVAKPASGDPTWISAAQFPGSIIGCTTDSDVDPPDGGGGGGGGGGGAGGGLYIHATWSTDQSSAPVSHPLERPWRPAVIVPVSAAPTVS